MMQVEITNIIDESYRVKRFELSTIDGSVIEFLPGQFIQIIHPSLPEFNNTRSYSISSENTVSNKIELCVALNENGVFTPWLFQKVIGSKLEISAPQGEFVLKEEHLDFPLIFICTGTGIAPFRSMIHSALTKGNQDVFLVFGNRKLNDILYEQEWDSLMLQNSKFHFIPVLSQESEFKNTGYVHEFYSNILREIGEARIFVCGWKDMCAETRNRLKEMGYNRRQYFFEQYN
jgi:CDP-4-dehydro-6-deoxyglucose reductase